MTKKKQKHPQQTVPAEENGTTKAAERKPNKKERKAAEAKRQKELQAIRKKYNIVILIAALLAVIVSFSSSSLYGQDLYNWIQIGCYLLMGFCGGLMMYVSRYEDTDKRKSSKYTMGLVFVVIALGMILSDLVRLFMQ